MYLSLYCKGLKRVTQDFTVRGSWRLNKDCNILTPLFMAISVVSFLFSWCSTGGPGAQLSAEYWLSLPHLVTNGSPKLLGAPSALGAPSSFGWEWFFLPHFISNFSGPQLIRGPKSPLRRAFSTTSYQQLLWTPTLWLPVLTELYNISTPTQSLEWHVWLSSSGNNCHAVQRSLSSGASVYECIVIFTLSHFISQICPCDLFRLLAIGMSRFPPVHHFGMACLPGPKVKIQYLYLEKKEKNIPNDTLCII